MGFAFESVQLLQGSGPLDDPAHCLVGRRHQPSAGGPAVTARVQCESLQGPVASFQGSRSAGK